MPVFGGGSHRLRLSWKALDETLHGSTRNAQAPIYSNHRHWNVAPLDSPVERGSAHPEEGRSSSILYADEGLLHLIRHVPYLRCLLRYAESLCLGVRPTNFPSYFPASRADGDLSTT